MIAVENLFSPSSSDVPERKLIVLRSVAKAAGEKYFFTGIACRNGHIAERFVANGKCVPCKKKWFRDNRDHHLAHKRRYRRENISLILMKEQEYRNANKPVLSARRRKWVTENRDKTAEIERRYYHANKTNIRVAQSSQRATRALAEGQFKPEDIERIRSAQGDRCAYCATRLRGKGHIDHIKAISRGGSNWPSNIQLTCAFCNLQKHARDPIEFAQSRGMLL